MKEDIQCLQPEIPKSLEKRLEILSQKLVKKCNRQYNII